jgi:tetratricopeptide (TPR) repeat protein
MQKSLRERYLELFSMSWNHSRTREAFTRLSQEAPESADGRIGVLLQARLAAQANRADHALALLDAALKKHPRDAYALLLKARILCLDKQRPKDALKVYHRLYRLQFDNSATGKWLWSLAVAGSATALTKLKKFPQSAARLEEVITRLARVRNPQLRLQLARAMVGKAFCYLRLDQGEEALKCADAAIGRFGKTDTAEFQEHLARAMVVKGLVHGGLERHREALEAFERVIQWFGAVERPETQEVVLTAWVNRGVALRKLDMVEDALAAFDTLVERFEGVSFPEVQEAVAMAMIGRAAARLDSGNPPYWGRRTVPPHREG